MKLLRKLPVIGPYLVRRSTPSCLIRERIKRPDAFIVQIGSNDGATKGDPIFALMRDNPGWRGLFVEPVPHVFKRLVANYGPAPRFHFENAAINSGIPQTFYWVDERARTELPDLPPYLDELGSFNAEHIPKHLPALKPYMREFVLQGLTLSQLFRKHQVEGIDLLHVDTEGYDWKILQQLDLTQWMPRLILFEHKHLSPEEFRAAREFFSPHYKLRKLKSDCFCWRRN